MHNGEVPFPCRELPAPLSCQRESPPFPVILLKLDLKIKSEKLLGWSVYQFLLCLHTLYLTGPHKWIYVNMNSCLRLQLAEWGWGSCAPADYFGGSWLKSLRTSALEPYEVDIWGLEWNSWQLLDRWLQTFMCGVFSYLSLRAQSFNECVTDFQILLCFP